MRLPQEESSGLLILRAPSLLDLAETNHFKLTGGVQEMSGSPGATRNSVASIPLVLVFRCFESGWSAIGPRYARISTDSADGGRVHAKPLQALSRTSARGGGDHDDRNLRPAANSLPVSEGRQRSRKPGATSIVQFGTRERRISHDHARATRQTLRTSILGMSVRLAREGRCHRVQYSARRRQHGIPVDRG